MRLVRTRGSGGKQTRQMLSELELRGARNTARTMPVVQRIVADVRKGGDRALRRYAAKLDRLGAAAATRNKPWRDGTGVGSNAAKALQAAMETAAGNIRRFAGRQMPKDWSTATNGLTTGTAGQAPRRGGMLRTQRTPSITLFAPDDSGAGAGHGRGNGLS